MIYTSEHHNYFLITKIRNVKTPSRAHFDDAGIDFYVPSFDEKFIEDFKSKNNSNYYYFTENKLIVEPNGKVLIPSGIKVVVPKGYALIAFNKSGIASKKGLVVGAQVVDSSYRGEVHINLLNVTSESQIIEEGQKIVQFILIPIALIDPIVIDKDEYEEYFNNTERGEGGFGSTGSK